MREVRVPGGVHDVVREPEPLADRVVNVLGLLVLGQEFLNISTTKFARPMNRNESRAYLDAVLSPLCEAFPTIALYREALDLRANLGYSFYDALIIAAALEAGCSTLYSEDLQDGQTVRDLKIVNPFGKLVGKTG